MRRSNLIGKDGILRSSEEVDFDDHPKFDCSYAKYILDKGEERLKLDGDKIVLRNVDLGKSILFLRPDSHR